MRRQESLKKRLMMRRIEGKRKRLPQVRGVKEVTNVGIEGPAVDCTRVKENRKRLEGCVHCFW